MKLPKFNWARKLFNVTQLINLPFNVGDKVIAPYRSGLMTVEKVNYMEATGDVDLKFTDGTYAFGCYCQKVEHDEQP